MNTILFITSSRIGDAVLTTGVLSHIHQYFPECLVTIAADPLSASLFQEYPLLDKLIIFSKQKYSRHWLALRREVKHHPWDWIIDLRGSLISYTLKCQKRSIWHQTKNDSRHKVEQICRLLNIPLTAPTLWHSQDQHEKAEALLPDGFSYLALAPAANWIGKQWPIERFTRIAQHFCERYKDTKIVLIAAPHEESMVAPLIKGTPSNRLINLVNKNLDLGQIGACLKRCQLFLGNDSGLMHMAAALEVPTIGLFGPSKEENYGPFDNLLLREGKAINKVVRIPQTYHQLKATSGFSLKSKDSYMKGLTLDAVWKILKEQWEKHISLNPYRPY